jgi:hypothetical protein
MSSHFEVENQIRLAQTSMDQPLSRGPLARWQRKHLESSTSNINNSLNASLHLNCPQIIDSVNLSFNVSNNNLNQQLNKTPNNTPNKRSTPNRTTPGISLKANNSSNKCKTPKTPCNGADRFIPNRNAMNLDISHYLVLISISLLILLIIIIFSIFKY